MLQKGANKGVIFYENLDEHMLCRMSGENKKKRNTVVRTCSNQNRPEGRICKITGLIALKPPIIGKM